MENKKIKKRRTKFQTKSEKILAIVFALLAVVVLGLGIAVMILNQNNRNKKDADIVVPVIEKNSNEIITIDISDMSKGSLKEYTFRITNYKDKKTINSKLEYRVTFSKRDQNVTLKLYKNNGTTDLLKEGTNLKVEKNMLSANKKQEDLYHLIIKSLDQPEKGSKIALQVTS